MKTLEKQSAASGGSCACCGERWRKCETIFAVVKNGKIVRGERYCQYCEQPARNNNQDLASIDYDDDERGLRDREAWASYQAAGATSEFWSDRDAGLI